MLIGEVARQTGLSIDAIRFYEKKRLLNRATRSDGGFRLFATADVDRLKFVRAAQQLGFSLEEVQELLSLENEEMGVCTHVQQLLENKLSVVQQKMDELNAVRKRLKGALHNCQNQLKTKRRRTNPCCPLLREISTKSTGGK